MKKILSVWRFAKKYKKYYILGLFVLFTVDIIQLFIPRFIKGAIDYITTGNIHIGPLVKYSLLIIGATLFIGVLRFLWRQLIIGSARRVERDIRNELFYHLLSLPIPFHDRKSIGDLMAHLTNDIESVRMAAGIAVVALFDSMVLSVLSIIMMAYISVKLTLIVVIPLPILSLYILFFNEPLHGKFKAVQAGFSRLTESARRLLSSIRMVKAFVQEKMALDRFAKSSEKYVEENISLVKIWGAFHPGIEFIISFSFVLILIFGGRYVITGEITLGDFIAYYSYLDLLIWPMIAIGWVINLIQRGSASMSRIDELFKEKVEIKPLEPVYLPDKIEGNIEFDNVSFKYKDEYILKDMSFNVKSGEVMGITGKIGSGKSTIFYLLLRFYDPDKGRILVDGKDIKHFDIDKYRNFIGYVPQDPFLFSATIKENIAFARPDASLDEIERVAKIAGIHDEIMNFPQGYDTPVGEKGITLSGGQKQRISIARALILNPAVLLLDDALSAVDTEKEIEIIDNLREYTKDMTVLISSHRISSLKIADKIIVIENGSIVEEGTHEELIEKDGYYGYIYKLQEVSCRA